MRDDILGSVSAIIAQDKAGSRFDGPGIIGIVNKSFDGSFRIPANLVNGKHLGQNTLFGAEFTDGIGPG